MTSNKTAKAVFFKLFLGALMYLLQKDTLSATCYKPNGEKTEFQRENFLVATTCLFMVMSTMPLAPKEIRRAMSDQKEYRYSWKHALSTIVPACLDVTAVLVMLKGLKYLAASVAVLVKGTRIIFTGGLSVFVLRKPLRTGQWLGVGLVCGALVPIFFESRAHAELEKERLKSFGKTVKDDAFSSTQEVLIGVGWIILSEFMRAVKFVFEEYLMKKKQMSTEFLLLSECSAGAIVGCALCAIASHRGEEDFLESWQLFTSSTVCQVLVISYALIASVCNIASVFVTKYLSSVFNAVISELRVALIFLPNVIRYQLDKHSADLELRKVKGEPLDWWSGLKILGFFFMLSGTYVFQRCSSPPRKELPLTQANSEAIA
jgi:drug/metabolite transporter (DMT)-like permease